MTSGRRRPYDRHQDETLAPLKERALAFRDDCRAHQWHLGLAVMDGAVECPTCSEPWPCKVAKAIYPKVKG